MSISSENCPEPNPDELGELEAYSVITALSAAVTVTATFVLAPLLGPFVGLPGVGTVLGAMGVIGTSSILTGLLFTFVWVLVFSMCRLQVRFGDLDFSSLAGRHTGDVHTVQGELANQPERNDDGPFPFHDGDYMYNVLTERLISATVGGAHPTGDITNFVERTPGGDPAVVRCDEAGNSTIHCEIDSARKTAGHIGWILAVLAVLVAAIVAAPALAAVEAACQSVPIVGPIVCSALAAIIALIVSAVGAAAGGAVGDAVDWASDPRDGVVEGTDEGWEPAVDECVVAQGIHVTDLDHGWNELHPLQSIQPCVDDIERSLEESGDDVEKKEDDEGIVRTRAAAW